MALFIIENYAGMTVENYTHANISEPIKVYSCDTFDIEVLGIEFDPNPDHIHIQYDPNCNCGSGNFHIGYRITNKTEDVLIYGEKSTMYFDGKAVEPYSSRIVMGGDSTYYFYVMPFESKEQSVSISASKLISENIKKINFCNLEFVYYTNKIEDIVSRMEAEVMEEYLNGNLDEDRIGYYLDRCLLLGWHDCDSRGTTIVTDGIYVNITRFSETLR